VKNIKCTEIITPPGANGRARALARGGLKIYLYVFDGKNITKSIWSKFLIKNPRASPWGIGGMTPIH
jgi:hypothetical protein